jgi:enamine deaminase RidA (YjgF/YER057c/UK114 family)
MRPINPAELGAPRGFTNGMLTPLRGRMLFVAGQTAADSDGRVEEPDFVAQFERALSKALLVVRAAGGRADHVARMTVYVTDLAAYQQGRRALGEVWQRQMGSHYPAMALVEVTGLVDTGALVEIEVTAVVPDP